MANSSSQSIQEAVASLKEPVEEGARLTPIQKYHSKAEDAHRASRLTHIGAEGASDWIGHGGAEIGHKDSAKLHRQASALASAAGFKSAAKHHDEIAASHDKLAVHHGGLAKEMEKSAEKKA